MRTESGNDVAGSGKVSGAHFTSEACQSVQYTFDGILHIRKAHPIFQGCHSCMHRSERTFINTSPDISCKSLQTVGQTGAEPGTVLAEPTEYCVQLVTQFIQHRKILHRNHLPWQQVQLV